MKDYGYVGIYCSPHPPVQIAIDKLKGFLEMNRLSFSEVMRYFPRVEVFQRGVSVGYFPTSIRQDIKSTARISLYSNGVVAFDSQADHLMDKSKFLNPAWLAYEVQRHLQLTKALLEEFEVQSVTVKLLLDYIQDFSMRFYSEFPSSDVVSMYSGAHGPISREIKLVDIHDFRSDRRNIVMPVVMEMMDEVSRIFGFSKTLPGLWDKTGKLKYVEGLENYR